MKSLSITSYLRDSSILLNAIQYLVFFFSPIGWLIFGISIMVCLDMISGIASARKKGEKIHSSGLYRTFVKFTLYITGIFATRIVELLIYTHINIPLSSLLAGFVIVIEYKSIMENVSSVLGIDFIEWLKNKISDIHPKKSNDK